MMLHWLRRKKSKEIMPPPDGLDMLSTEFFNDPYPYYKYLRNNEPAHWTKQGCLLLTRQEQVLRALKNPVLGSAPADFATTHPRNRQRFVCADVASNLLPFLDGSDYVRTRQFLGPVLRKTFEESPPDTEGPARRILEPLLEKGTFDVLTDFGRPLSLQVICKFMGIPLDNQDDLCRWTDNFFRIFAPLPKAAERNLIDEGLTQFRGYFRDIVERCRRSPGDDFISRLILKKIDGAGMSDEQIIDNCMLVFADAIENVDAAIAGALLALHQHPKEFRKLRKQPELLPGAVEESLRFDAPGQTAPRIVRDDTQIEGVTARRNSVVLLGLGSSNRDESVYKNPDVFDLSRPKQEHLSFGKGNHSCLGFFVVRSEMQAALGALIEGTRDIEVHDHDLSWEHRPGHRWLSALHVTVKRK
jgi:cytochrome P450